MDEYRNTFDQLSTAARDLEQKLPLVAALQTSEEIRRLVMLVKFFLLRYNLSLIYQCFIRSCVTVGRKFYLRTAHNLNSYWG